MAFTRHCLRRTFVVLLKQTLEVDAPTAAVLLNHPQGVTQKRELRSQPMDFRALYQHLNNVLLTMPP